MARSRLRRRYGRIFGRKPQGPSMRKYVVYRHGEFDRSVNYAIEGATKEAREERVRRLVTPGGVDNGIISVEEVYR